MPRRVQRDSIETLPADQQETARKEWARILRPFKRRGPWL